MKYLWRLSVLILSIAVLANCKGDQETAVKSEDNVLNSLGTMIKQSPDDASLFIDRAKYLYQQESYDAAIKDVRKAISIDSLQPSFHYLLSDIYLDYYQSKNAIRTLVKAERQFPNDIRTKLKLSEDYLILKDYENALIFAHKILNIDPLNPDAYFMIGLINQENNNIDNAITSFKKSVELDPEQTDAWIILGDLLGSKDDPSAIEYYDASIEVDRNNISALHSKAYYLQNHNQQAEAIELYESIKKLNRQYEPAYLNTGILHLSQDSISQAYDQFNILVNNNPLSDQGFYYRGITNELLGNSELALEDYQTAVRINPKHEKALAAVMAQGEQ